MINLKNDEKTSSKSPSSSQGKKKQYLLSLYVTGMSPKSIQAIQNIKKICEEHLKGRYELEVIDIRQQPELAKEVGLIAAPTLIKQLPLPLRRLIGDMSDTQRVLYGLNVVLKEK